METAAPARPRRVRWVLRALYALALLLVAALGIAWWERRLIADDVLRRELARRGVQARYRIADIGLARQRIEHVVIGDPANPDLVADWIEVGTSLGLGTAEVTGVRVGHVRMRARLVNGKLSLGELDKLMPASTPGQPFALPALFVDAGDARVRLETAMGVVGMKISGSGRLDDGFSGRLAAVSERLEGAGCAGERLGAYLSLSIRDAQPIISGPVRAHALNCGDARIAQPAVMIDARLDSSLDRWQGSARLAADAARGVGAAARAIRGMVSFDGGPKATRGSIDLTTGAFAMAGRTGGRLGIEGDYQVGPAGNRFEGAVSAGAIRLSAADRAAIAAAARSAQGTPLAPLAVRLAQALARAGAGMDGQADLSLAMGDQGGTLTVQRAQLNGAGGALATLSDGNGVVYRWPDAGLVLDGTLSLSGGDLPATLVHLNQAGPGAPINGTAIIQPYAAGGAKLALTPVSFTAAGGRVTRVRTRATLSGPLSGGRVDALTLPIDVRWSAAGVLALNPGCTAMGWQRLAVSSLVLNPGTMSLCPTGAALMTLSGGRVSGGARMARAALHGRIGSTPLDLAASGGMLGLNDRGFTLQQVAARLGSGDDRTRLDLSALTGRVGADGALTGTMTGADGKITKVPLLISNGAGEWRLAGGVLSLGGALDVTDAQSDQPRFERMHAPDFALTLKDGAIHATGTLNSTAKGAKVADLVIDHDLGTTTGRAAIDVPGVAFTPDGLQPADLTQLTKGVIAAVKGMVSGRGDIAWNADGVTSSGRFRTDGADLAAAFGPVTGLTGEIRFTDLLGLETAPGQVATLDEVNPGVPVKDGAIRYQLLPGQRVAIEGGRWPFAGGELTLDPTVLDFSQSVPRHMTFRVNGVDGRLFLQQFDFQNLDATGTFDGVLPMVFDDSGGKIVGGRLQVREAGGTIAYVGEVSQKDVGVWGNVAFQALKSLRYRSLYLEMNGPLDGEMVTAIHFSGVSQGAGTKTNFIIARIAKLPFVFNVTVTAPFRQLIDSFESIYDPKRLIERNLPALIQQQNGQGAAPKPAPVPTPSPSMGGGRAVQPLESETMP